VSGTEIDAAKLTPHSVQISGALNTPEVLMTTAVAVADGGAWRVDLDLATPAAARLGLATPLTPDSATAVDGENQKVLESIFLTGTEKKGKLIRLRRNGLDQYAAVSAVKAMNGAAYLTLATPSTLIRLVKGGPQCGVDDTGKGMALSVIDLVRYDIRSMKTDATYNALRTASGASVPGEDKRAELVRVELDSDLQEVDSTREIVGEYAVDLRVGAWGATSSFSPTLVPIDAAAITQNYGFTQLLRGVHLRVAVRSREADRDADISGAAPNLYRIGVGADGKAPYARVRTLQSDVPLRNLESARW
jgi:hypothetical protein